MSDTNQVRSLYLDYVRRLSSAERVDDGHRRKYLSQWLAEPALSNRVRGINEFVESGRITEGRRISHIDEIKITNSRARVSDCVDESGAVVKDSDSNEILDRGKKYVWRVATLKHNNGVWRITEVAVGDDGCDRN